MRIRNQLYWSILPIIPVAILILGWWHYQTAASGVLESSKLYTQTMLRNYIVTELQHRDSMLNNMFMYNIPSFVESFHKEALHSADAIASANHGDFLIINITDKQVLHATGTLQQPDIQQLIITDNNNDFHHIDDSHLLLQHQDFLPWQWRIYFAVEDSAYHRAMDAILQSTLVVGGLLLIMVVVILYFISSHIFVTPIENLSQFARKIANMEPPDTIPIHTHNEMGSLARDMEAMAQKIHFNQEQMEQQVMSRTRELQRAGEKLQRSNKELQDFAYVASHDLQEPLRMIASYMQLLQRRYKDKLDDSGREFIDFAIDGAKRLTVMIEGLLQYSRIETQGELFDTISCSAALEDALANLQLLIKERQAEVIFDNLPEIEGDYGQISRLLQNLIANSLKFSTTNPKITIRCEDIGEHIRIAVHDNGIGFDESKIDHIFTMFQRLHTREEYEGNGIGLAICKRIVERHGGTITATSAPNEGATFTFTLQKHYSLTTNSQKGE